MASVSVSHLVLFIASILIAASVAGTLITGVDRVSDAMDHQSLDTSETIEADITIISDTGSDAIYGDGTVELLVKNTGGSTLPIEPERFDILINGRYITPANVTVTPLPSDTERTDWPSGTVVSITIDESLDVGDHRATVRIRGNEDVITFRVSES